MPRVHVRSLEGMQGKLHLEREEHLLSGEIILLGLARGDNGRALIESEHNQKFKKRDIT